MNNETRVHRRWRRRASTVIGLGAAMVAAVAVPAFAHPSFPNGGPGFPNPNGGTGAGTATPPYAPGSINTLNLRVPFERDGVIFNGALNTTVDIKAIVPAGWTSPTCGAASTSVGASQVGSAVPGWTCAVETASGHQVLHWHGPQVSATQTANDSAQFFTFGVTVPSPANLTSYGANGSPAEGFFVTQQYADPTDASIWKCPNDPRPATDVASGLVRTVAGTSPPPPTPTPLPPPVVHATDGKIVFQSGRDGNNEIYLMNADGTSVTRLTNNPASDSQPALSPDGARITFTSNRDGVSEIYVMNADGTGLTRLTHTSVSGPESPFSPANSQPVFSPDGTQIAFVRFANTARNIFIMNGNGTGQTNLTNNSASNGGPVFGPSDRIAFHSNSDANSNEIYLMNSDGTGVTRLTNNPAVDERPAFSPDGTKIVFATDRSGNREIDVTNTDGSSGALNLTNNSAVDDWARTSPIPGAVTTTKLTASPIRLPFGLGGYVLPIARVAPFNAAGSVQFKDGNTNIGPRIPVTGGIAVGRLVSLPPGSHSLTATFIPANLAAFQLSTSNTVAFTL
ncbi:MAG: hypothetical protein ACRDTX_20735 [Pseudonocardiaceae bacterium]